MVMRFSASDRRKKPVPPNRALNDCHVLYWIESIDNLPISSIECQCGSISTHITPRRIHPSFPTFFFHVPLSNSDNLAPSEISTSSDPALNLHIMTQLFQS